jgi:hypothetical protein
MQVTALFTGRMRIVTLCVLRAKMRHLARDYRLPRRAAELEQYAWAARCGDSDMRLGQPATCLRPAAILVTDIRASRCLPGLGEPHRAIIVPADLIAAGRRFTTAYPVR